MFSSCGLCSFCYICGAEGSPLPSADSSCLWNQFACSKNKCIAKQWLCDGENDCEDGLDESAEICGEGGAVVAAARKLLLKVTLHKECATAGARDKWTETGKNPNETTNEATDNPDGLEWARRGTRFFITELQLLQQASGM